MSGMTVVQEFVERARNIFTPRGLLGLLNEITREIGEPSEHLAFVGARRPDRVEPLRQHESIAGDATRQCSTDDTRLRAHAAAA